MPATASQRVIGDARGAMMALFELQRDENASWHEPALRTGIEICRLTEGLLSGALSAEPRVVESPGAWRALGSQLSSGDLPAVAQEWLKVQAIATATTLESVLSGDKVPGDVDLEEAEDFFRHLLLRIAA
jgi:hypothetical protein